jgi:hypothetical protein
VVQTSAITTVEEEGDDVLSGKRPVHRMVSDRTRVGGASGMKVTYEKWQDSSILSKFLRI